MKNKKQSRKKRARRAEQQLEQALRRQNLNAKKTADVQPAARSSATAHPLVLQPVALASGATAGAASWGGFRLPLFSKPAPAAPAALVRPKPRKNLLMQLPAARRRSAALLWWSLPVVAIGGWYYPYLGFLMLLCMIAPFVVGLVRGRYWCGWMCPRGAFFDYIMGRFSRNKSAPAWLRSKPFRIGMMIFLMGMMGTQITLAWPDPVAIGRVFIMLLSVTTVVGIVLAMLYKPRTWCSFCPMGTLTSWVSRGKRPLTVASACRNCSACAKVCPMDLTPQRPDHTHADCIKCTRCVELCPWKSLSFEQQQPQTAEQSLAA